LARNQHAEILRIQNNNDTFAAIFCSGFHIIRKELVRIELIVFGTA
jgi:hypothetical protein